jgi:His/Glu/Gln/Arg/opine family amino acid ABC transporter permease subunit
VRCVIETLRDYAHHIYTVMPALWHGALIAIFVVICAEIIGSIIGVILALCRLSKKRRFIWPAAVYVDLIRGTPMLVQILFIYFGLPSVISAMTGGRFNIDPLVAGIVALGLNSGAYVSEIYRTAIGSIDRGQTEAAKSLGMTPIQTMRHVIFPQAFRWAIPPLGNEFITLLKDTSLLSVIAVMDIVKQGQIYMSRTYAIFPTYLGIAMVYVVLTLSISYALRIVEKRLRIPT